MLKSVYFLQFAPLYFTENRNCFVVHKNFLFNLSVVIKHVKENYTNNHLTNDSCHDFQRNLVSLNLII